MSLKRLLAVILVAAMTVTVLFSCGGGTKKGMGGNNPLTAEECLNKIFENSIPELEKTTVGTTIDVISAGAQDPFNRITLKSIVSPTSESYVLLEVMDPAGNKVDMAVYSGNSGAVVTSRLFESNYLVSVDFLKNFLAGMGETAQSIAGILTGELGSVAQSPELEKTVNKYVSLLEKAMTSASDKKLVIKPDAFGVTVTFNGDSVKKVIRDVYNEAKKDQTLKTLILDAAESYDPEGYNAFVSEYEGFFGSETKLNELFDKINSYGDTKLEVTVTADKTFKMNGLCANLSTSEGNALLEYETKSVTGGTRTTLTAQVSGFGLEEEIDYALSETVTADDEGKKYTLELFTGDIALALPIMNMTLDNEGNYVCTVNGDTIEGTYAVEESKTAVTVNKYASGDDTTFLNVTVTVDNSAQLPKFPTSYVNAFDLAPEELNALIETVKTNRTVSNLYAFFSEMLGETEGSQGNALPDEA